MNKTFLFKNFLNKFLLLATFALVFQFSFADELKAKWFVDSLEVNKGDMVKVNVFLYPDPDQKVVTISSNLFYDPKSLDFVDSKFLPNWIELSKDPYYLTDTESGMIRRTASYPGGVDVPAKYVTYTFKAIKTGKTKLNIQDGTVLDTENQNLGLQSKEMTLNINESVSTSTKKEETETVELNVALGLKGKIAIHEGEDYDLTVYSEALTGSDISSYNVYLVDSSGKEVFRNSSSIKEGDLPKQIKISKDFLKPGEYVLYVSPSGDDSAIITKKEIAVLKTDRTYLDLHKREFYLLSLFVIFLAFLYHLYRDHEFILSLKSKKRRRVM